MFILQILNLISSRYGFLYSFRVYFYRQQSFSFIFKKCNHNKASLSFGRTTAEIVWCFGGIFHSIETTMYELMDDLIIIAELTLNYLNQKNIWNSILIKSCIPIGQKYQYRKPNKVAEDICISPHTKGESW